MEKIVKITYKSFFGYHYETEEECLNHEKIMKDILEILKPLKPIPNGKLSRDWYNDGGYIQQDINIVKDVRSKILLYLKELFNNEDFNELFDKILNIKSGIELIRVLDFHLYYSKYVYLMEPFNRVVCTDENGKEYAKIYFIRNPKERKHKEIIF
jgi:hypothetical protein